MSRRFSTRLSALVFGLSLLSFPALSAEPKPVAAGDVLDFCATSLPDDAAKKAQNLGWQRLDGQKLESVRGLVDPLGDRKPDIQAWQNGEAPESDLLVYAYETQTSDGSFVSMLKSFAPRPHSCVYMTSGNAASFKTTLTDRLGPPNEQTTEHSKWETSSAEAILREFPGTSDPHTVSLLMLYK